MSPSVKVAYLNRNQPGYPGTVKTYLGEEAPERIAALGDAHSFACRCSPSSVPSSAPGPSSSGPPTRAALCGTRASPSSGASILPRKECLTLLLRGTQPIVVCPARSLETLRLPPQWKGPLREGRLLIVSPFAEAQKRVTEQTAEDRNRFAAALARALLVIHADPGGKTETFCREWIESGKPVYTLESDHNRNLVELGATAAGAGQVVQQFG